MSANWKIIAVDNFNREHISDRLVQDNLSKEDALAAVQFLNSAIDPRDSLFYKAVPGDHKLYVFVP